MDTHQKGRHCVNSAAPDQENEQANSTSTQEAQILAALLAGDELTPADALKRFGCFRLAAVIFKLKRKGHPIQKTPINIMGRHGRARVARYHMDLDHAKQKPA